MFTGIIEEKGSIRHISISGTSGNISVVADTVLGGTVIGDSIAVNGVCLTVTALRPDGFSADVMAETIRQTGLGSLSPGSMVNLERAMAADGRFGGHFVTGHITGTGSIDRMWKEENATWVSINAPSEILRYIVERGSIAIDGMSLTVAYVDDASFRVSIIPHTADNTTILDHNPGDVVNLEIDIIAKYIEKLIQGNNNSSVASNLTMDRLLEEGF